MTQKFDLLTPEEISQQLRIPKGSVYDLARKGKIPSAFKVGKHWRFRKDLILQWIQEETGKTLSFQQD